MAVPKRYTSKARRNSRRSAVWKLTPPTLVRCKECKELIAAHRVCPSCGYYGGKAVVLKAKD
ncbi:MAG: 50S ribosomal protein L32 [Clostridia bacterium]|nr:50S ribosomal protein L32 [Clostridia bacterium]MBQ3076847.1 50S ribosomal protein L32 [Clostridia bacterium]